MERNNIQTHTQKKTYPIIYIEMNIETKEGFTTFFCLFLQGRGQKRWNLILRLITKR